MTVTALRKPPLAFTPEQVARALAKGACPSCTTSGQIHYHAGPCPFTVEAETA